MKPPPFQYHRPYEVHEALSLLKDVGDKGKVLAGGQSLIPLMNFRLAQPHHLIDINFIEGLDYVKRESDGIKIGCLVRQSRLQSDSTIRRYCPLLAEACLFVGCEQTRNRGTLCGSLAHADPAAEFPAVLVALDGKVTVRGIASKRDIKASDLFVSYLTTSVEADEMIVEAWIPEIPAGAGWSFKKFSRRFGDFAIVGVAVLLVANGKRIADARIALTGVAHKPWRDRGVEEMFIGAEASEEVFTKIGAEIAARVTPISDIHASESYRRALAEVLTRRAVVEAWSKAKRGN